MRFTATTAFVVYTAALYIGGWILHVYYSLSVYILYMHLVLTFSSTFNVPTEWALDMYSIASSSYINRQMNNSAN